MKQLVAGSVALFAAMSLAVPAVFAHARLDRSEPAAGAVLDAAPAQVEVFFSQEIQKVSSTYGLQVETSDGASVTAGDPVVDDFDRTHMTVDLQPDLGEGRYVVHWQNVSDADGDPAEGAFAFYVDRQPTPEEQALDEELAAVGAEEEEETPAAGTAEPEATAAETPAATPDGGTAVDTGGDGGGTNTWLIVGLVVGGIVAVGVIGGGWALTRRR